MPHQESNWLQGPRGGQYRIEKTAGGEERKVYRRNAPAAPGPMQRAAGGRKKMKKHKNNKGVKGRSRSAGHWHGGRGGIGVGLGAGLAAGALAGAAFGPYPYGAYYPPYYYPPPYYPPPPPPPSPL